MLQDGVKMCHPLMFYLRPTREVCDLNLTGHFGL